MLKSRYMSLRLLTLISLEFKLYFRKKGNFIFFTMMPLICGALLRFSTNNSTFSSYGDGLPIIFAFSCTAILLGLVLSINMVCKDFAITHRKLRKGLPPAYVILSKTFLVAVICFIMASILTAVYLLTLQVADMLYHNYIIFFLSVFLTMLASAELGLLVSTWPRITSDLASTLVSFIISYQILFSSFLFGATSQVNQALSLISFSRYSITALGSSIGLGSFNSDFVYSKANTLPNLFALAAAFIVLMVVSCLLLLYIDLD